MEASVNPTDQPDPSAPPVTLDASDQPPSQASSPPSTVVPSDPDDLRLGVKHAAEDFGAAIEDAISRGMPPIEAVQIVQSVLVQIGQGQGTGATANVTPGGVTITTGAEDAAPAINQAPNPSGTVPYEGPGVQTPAEAAPNPYAIPDAENTPAAAEPTTPA